MRRSSIERRIEDEESVNFRRNSPSKNTVRSERAIKRSPSVVRFQSNAWTDYRSGPDLLIRRPRRNIADRGYEGR